MPAQAFENFLDLALYFTQNQGPLHCLLRADLIKVPAHRQTEKLLALASTKRHTWSTTLQERAPRVRLTSHKKSATYPRLDIRTFLRPPVVTLQPHTTGSVSRASTRTSGQVAAPRQLALQGHPKPPASSTWIGSTGSSRRRDTDRREHLTLQGQHGVAMRAWSVSGARGAPIIQGAPAMRSFRQGERPPPRSLKHQGSARQLTLESLDAYSRRVREDSRRPLAITQSRGDTNGDQRAFAAKKYQGSEGRKPVYESMEADRRRVPRKTRVSR